MTESNSSEIADLHEAKLPRRDWILLPLLGLVTVALLVIGTETVARLEFRDAGFGLASCLVLNDLSTGVRGVPNSECRDKALESSWTDYKFNSCGHRAGMECGAKDPASYRVVMTGSSVAMGLDVAREQSIAGLLPSELSSLSGRKIELYNASIGAAYGGTPHSIGLRFNEVLAAKPDLILWVLTPWDVDHAPDLQPQDEYLRAVGQGTSVRVPPSFMTSVPGRAVRAVGAEPAANWLYVELKAFRFRTLLTHNLFMSQSLYVKSFLMNGDDAVGFLKTDWSPGWKARLSQFDQQAANIEALSKTAGIPLAVVLVPNRAQAAMISMGEWPEGYDPYKIDSEVRSVIASHGGIYVDIFPSFRTVSNPENHYLPVDGHPDAAGHAMISGFIAQELTGGTVPPLRAATQSSATLAKTR